MKNRKYKLNYKSLKKTKYSLKINVKNILPENS
jgi:hypothetical protein